jgi:hypothetical protein
MRGSLEQRSKGSWRLRYDGPSDARGKRKQITETVRGTKRQAEAVLRDRLAAIENGGYVPKQKETVAEFMQRWLDSYVATNTTLRTQQGYRGYVKQYIPAVHAGHPIPEIGFYPDLSVRGLPWQRPSGKSSERRPTPQLGGHRLGCQRLFSPLLLLLVDFLAQSVYGSLQAPSGLTPLSA